MQSLAVNAWGPFLITYDQNHENGWLENYVCVWAFKHRPVPIDQVFCIGCMLCLLQSWRFQLSALPGQTMQRAQNTVDYLSHVFLQACTHLHQHKCKDVFKYPFVQRNRRCRSRQILGMEGFLPEFSQTYLKKTPKKWPPKKSSSCHFGRHFFQIKACWAPFLLIFSGSSWKFSEILPGFYPDFYQIRTFGGALVPPAPPLPTPVKETVWLLAPLTFLK